MKGEPTQDESLESLADVTREWLPLTGGTLSEVWRSGDFVKWARVPASDAVVQLLTWITARGVPGVPEFVAMSEENVYFKYLEGETVLRPWTASAKSDAWVIQLGKWLSSYHAAVKGFRLRSGASFLWGPAESEPGMLVCHGDLGPWNFLQKDGRLTGVIDWHLAHFGPPLDDLASMAIESIPLRKSMEGTMGEQVPRPVLLNRLQALLNAYGEIEATDLFSHALEYLDRLIRETQKCADAGIAPFVEFVRRGFLAEYAADQAYIRDYWLRGVRH